MKRRPIPDTDLAVSRLGLGTVKFGRNEGVRYPAGFDLPSDEDILALLDRAREEDINLLDTAPAYGTSEERLGRLLGDRRDEWVIASKAGETFENGRSHFDFSPEAIASSLDRTLERLRTDRVEVLLLHSDGNDLDILDHSGAVDALHAAREGGKARAIGISTKTAAGGERAVALGLDVVMAAYNPWHSGEESVLDAAAAAGTAVFVKKALGSGWFGGADAGGPDPVETAFRFIFDHPGATSVIVGTLDPEHLRDNCAALRRVEAD